MLNAPEESVRRFIATQYAPGNTRGIQVLCPYSELKELFERIKNQWVSIGETEPYASVLADEKYLRKNIDLNLVEFHQTGESGMKNLASLCSKNNVPLPNRVLFELGCGVGRSTQFFSTAFETVHAWDVSAGNLEECKISLISRGVGNVKLKLVSVIDDYSAIPEHDVFFSEIVVQHNPPPLQYYLLDQVLSRLKPGGVFFFQTITHHPDYAFVVSDYLKWKHEQDYEMHALPMRWITALLRKNNLFLLDVLKDRLGGFNLDSYTFFGIRPN